MADQGIHPAECSFADDVSPGNFLILPPLIALNHKLHFFSTFLLKELCHEIQPN